MPLSLLQRNQLDYALRIGGYHNACEVDGEWIAADATFAPGRCFLAYSPASASRVIVATSLPHVARSFAEEGHVPHSDVALPADAVNAFEIDIPDLHAAVRRLFELSRSLPSAPLDRFYERTRSLPSTTEVERLVFQRIGQDIFREALMDFWSARCAVNRAHRLAALIALGDDLRLLRRGPGAAPSAPGKHFQPAHRLGARLGQKLSVRHVSNPLDSAVGRSPIRARR